MQLENLYFLSQILASLAVMASLIYLATQIRFAKLAAADLSRLTRVTGVRENLRETANNAELRKNWLKSTGLESAYETLGSSLGVGADAAVQIDFMCQSWMWLHWGALQFNNQTIRPRRIGPHHWYVLLCATNVDLLVRKSISKGIARHGVHPIYRRSRSKKCPNHRATFGES